MITPNFGPANYMCPINLILFIVLPETKTKRLRGI